MKQSVQKTDFLVVGAGFGGLATAALLARRGCRVVLIEAMGLPGGCAQTFRRGRYRFDAGATTVVGLEPPFPLGELARDLGIRFEATQVEPAMSVWLDGERLDRHTDRRAWIDVAERRFGKRQRAFWEDVYRTSDLAWAIAQRARRFPPASLGDAAATVRDVFPYGMRLVPALVSSTSRRMRSHLRTPGDEFVQFVDEQLLITAQASPDRVPFAVGAMGLSYTNLGNYVVPGGVGALAEHLVRSIRANGGEVQYGRRAERITQTSEGYRVETKRGVYVAQSLVANLTIWDLAKICDGDMGAYFQKSAARHPDAWGAFMLYLGVEDTFADDLALHHQVIFERPIPVVGGRSAFVSLSPRGDLLRAPSGFRTVTISTHTPVGPWWETERERYDDVKETVANAILARIAAHAPGLGNLAVETQLTGTPRTFDFYTHRAFGRVGGLPSTFATLLRSVTPVTPFRGVYLVGDTVYPGQGLPAVVLGARNILGRMGLRDHAPVAGGQNFSLSPIQPERYTSQSIRP